MAPCLQAAKGTLLGFGHSSAGAAGPDRGLSMLSGSFAQSSHASNSNTPVQADKVHSAFASLLDDGQAEAYHKQQTYAIARVKTAMEHVQKAIERIPDITSVAEVNQEKRDLLEHLRLYIDMAYEYQVDDVSLEKEKKANLANLKSKRHRCG